MKISKVLSNKEATNAGWLIGGKIAQIGIQLLVTALSARYLGPSNYGLLNYGASFVLFFTPLSYLGINSVIIKDYIDHPDEIGVANGSAIIFRAIASFISIVSIFFITIFADRGDFTSINVVLLCSLSLIFQIFDTISLWFQARYQSKVTAISTFISYCISSTYKIVLLIIGASVQWFALGTSVDAAMSSACLLIAYKKYKGPKLKFSFEKGRNLLKQGYHYILSGTMVAIYGQTDKFMLKHMVNSSEVGFYSTAYTLANMWTFILNAIISSMYPTILQLYGSDYKRYERKNRQLYGIIIYSSAFVSIGLLIFGRLVIQLLYGEQYLSAYQSIKIITWYTSFSYLGVARNAWIVSEGKQKYLKYMYGCAVLINISLNSIFIPKLGAPGAAIASLITEISTSIILPLCIRELRPNVKLMLEALLLKDFGRKNYES